MINSSTKLDPDKLFAQSGEKEKAMFEFYKKNPDIACFDLLNLDLAPFQRIVVRGVFQHSYVMSILSRGSGKTRMIGACAALEAMFNPKKRIGTLSPTFRNSKMCFNEFVAIHDEAPFLQACVKRISRQTDMWIAEFYNGAVIMALPLAADSEMSIRGTRVHTALIDEYPHVPEEVIERIITPMLATQRNPMANVRRIQKEKKLIAEGRLLEKTENEKNKVCGFSSAYFQFNHMYKTVQNYKEQAIIENRNFGRSNYAVYCFNYKDAPEGFFDTEMIEHAKRNSSELTFNMEYLSEFPKDSEGFFKRSLLDSCVAIKPDEFGIELRGEKDARYVLGVDPARNNDTFGLGLMKLVGEQMRLIRVLSFEKMPFPEMAEKVRELCRDYNIIMIGMDAGGGGLAIKDLLANPMTAQTPNDILLDMDDESTIGVKGKRILRMINFATGWITDANFDMRSSMEHKKFKIPSIHSSETYIKPEVDASDLMDTSIAELFDCVNQIQLIEMTATKTGALHFDVPRQSLKKDKYSAVLIAHKILYDFIKAGYCEKELAIGGWLGMRGIESSDNRDFYESQDDWAVTKSLDYLNSSSKKVSLDDASLI